MAQVIGTMRRPSARTGTSRQYLLLGWSGGPTQSIHQPAIRPCRLLNPPVSTYLNLSRPHWQPLAMINREMQARVDMPWHLSPAWRSSQHGKCGSPYLLKCSKHCEMDTSSSLACSTSMTLMLALEDVHWAPWR